MAHICPLANLFLAKGKPRFLPESPEGFFRNPSKAASPFGKFSYARFLFRAIYINPPCFPPWRRIKDTGRPPPHKKNRPTNLERRIYMAEWGLIPFAPRKGRQPLSLFLGRFLLRFLRRSPLWGQGRPARAGDGQLPALLLCESRRRASYMPARRFRRCP